MDHFSATTSAPIPAPSLPLTDFDKALAHGVDHGWELGYAS
jgi:hypothetical protein